MNKFRNLSGSVHIRITSAEPLVLIQKLLEKGFALFDIAQIDVLTFTARISAKDYRRLCAILDQIACKYHVINRGGAYWFLRASAKRGVLIAGILLILFATVLIPTRIFFFDVIGNETIPDRYILECAEACGITFGASRRQVRSEKMKNALLEAVPELQWAGINTSGCVATIQVREKNVTHPSEGTAGISNIVAERDGIIYSCTVEEGNLLCRVGQAVSKGQILVSGYQDAGLLVTGKPVKADIYALTQRTINTVSPCTYQKRGSEESGTVRYSIRIGKNIINLYKDSGIYDSTCVKMYSEEYISLPGGFRLPVAIITERSVRCDLWDEQESDLQRFKWIEAYAEDYITQQMIAGQILHADTSGEIIGQVCVQSGQYACIELIGKNKTEEIIESYG